MTDPRRTGRDRPPLEIGVVFAGAMDQVDREAVEAAVANIGSLLQERLPEFCWRLPQLRRDEWVDGAKVEPTDLLEQAREERDAQGWDFAVVVTAADLSSHYKPFSLAVISRALDVAIVSTARIDPRATKVDCTAEERRDLLCVRFERLVLHAVGHWTGLKHHADADNIMHDVESIDALAVSERFTDEQCDQMRDVLAAIADLRLEEREDIRRSWSLSFFVRAAWENRGEILDAVVQARPWEFPIRLSRLTTAAVSTTLVLLMTAETWDMAMSQSPASVALLFVTALALTTGYIALRQQLLLRRSSRHLSEQIVTTNVAALATVACGMACMFVVLAVMTLISAALLFPQSVVTGWAASVHGPIEASRYLLLAGTVGSLGITIGALGASFEEQQHFRHVIFVDEEV